MKKFWLLFSAGPSYTGTSGASSFFTEPLTGLSAILFAVITPAQWFARKISKVVQESGDYNTIRRVLISRAEIDMYAIRDYYYMETNNELRTDIQDENEDAYGQILTNLSLK